MRHLRAISLTPFIALGCQKVAAEKPPEARPVVVVVAKLVSAIEAQTYTGVVRARVEADLAFRVGGKIVARTVEVGDRVAPGQVLATLDPTDYDLAVHAAEADLAAAQFEAIQTARDDARTVELAATGAISALERDTKKLAKDAARERSVKAQNNLDIARNRLSYCQLKAGAAGVVTATPREAGEVVTDGDAVLRVAQSGELEAVVSVPENRLTLARTGEAVAKFWATGATAKAKVREVSPAADPVTRTYAAKFTLLDPPETLRLGMTATVTLTPQGAVSAIVLPATAVVQHDGNPSVWVVSGSKIKSVPVKVRSFRQDLVVVESGLDGGEVVVRAGGHTLDAGQSVRVVGEVGK